MRKVSTLLMPYKSFYAAEKDLYLELKKLKRWSEGDALVDDKGQVYIKTGRPIKEWKI